MIYKLTKQKKDMAHLQINIYKCDLKSVEVTGAETAKQTLTPDMVSHAGLNLWYGYLRITGRTGAFGKNAPVLNGRR